MPKLSIADLESLAERALARAGASNENAVPVARSLVRAEAEDNPICGLFYLPVFCDQLRRGRVKGAATPRIVFEKGSVAMIDAADGFAQPAFALGLPILAKRAHETGIAALAIRNSYNALALGHPALALAEAGLIGLCLANAPASVGMPGVPGKLFGTNPLAFAVPGPEGAVLLIDQSSSAIAKTEIMMRAERGDDIPLGWGQDAEGQPTTHPEAALEGAILPAGGIKGANIALVVEVLAAALTGSLLSAEAPPFGADDERPSRVGQFLIAIDPMTFAGDVWAERIDLLTDHLKAEGRGRIPGARRFANQETARLKGIDLSEEVLERLRDLAGVSGE